MFTIRSTRVACLYTVFFHLTRIHNVFIHISRCLSDLVFLQPHDPIEYIAEWLRAYAQREVAKEVKFDL